MTIKGNYWTDLIEKESNLKKEIESTIKKYLGTKFYDYQDMTSNIRDSIKVHLEMYSVKHHMGVFNIEYDLDLKYDSKFKLTGFEVKQVYLIEQYSW